MSSNHYLEFDSTYRNRVEYPEPAEFIIQMAMSGQKSKETALDPVTYSSPILYWNNSFTEENSSYSNTVSVDITTSTGPTGAYSDQGLLKITSITGGSNQLRQIKDYYTGAVIHATINSVEHLRRIISYEPLNLTTGLIKVDTPFPAASASFNITGATIGNPTPLATNTGSAVIKFFIPAGSYIDNYYVNMYIQSVDGSGNIQDTRTITAYDGYTKMATLSTATTSDWVAASPTCVNFIIRKEVPCIQSTQAVASTNSTFSAVYLPSLSAGYNNYKGDFLRMLGPVPSYPAATSAPWGNERKIVKYIGDGGLILAATATTFTLSNTASNIDEYYTGCILYTGTSTYVIVSSYNGATRSGTLSGTGWGGTIPSPNTAWQTFTAFLDRPLLGNPISTSQKFEIECFSRDNATPFNYTGSLDTTQQMTCYEVELLNLILPNIILDSGRGGRPAFYPYLYVELQQVSAANSGNKAAIYSNNPNSNKMIFRAVVDDTPTPLISPFIKIDGDGMVQSMKFKPTDSFKFSVRHANGELFKTSAHDFYSPSEPNPLVQISACFAFRKI